MVTNELTYNLSGNVRHQGLPVAGVIVVLLEVTFGSGERTMLSQHKTGQRGDFSFAVGPGNYCLEIVPDGGTRFVRQLITNIDVSSNTTFNVILSTGFTLKGKVCTGGGGAIRNCAVTALGIEPLGLRAFIPSDGNGNYTTVLPRGRYYLIPSWYPTEDPTDCRMAQPQFLTTWHELVELEGDDTCDIVLSDLTPVRSSVVDKAGNPVSGAKVELRPSVDPDNPLAKEISSTINVYSDPWGNFDLMLQPGNYDVVLTPPGSSSLCSLSYKAFPLGKESTQKFELIEGVRLRGKVTFQTAPLGQCLVTARSKDGKLSYSCATDDHGIFTIGLPAGSYELTVLPGRGRRRRHAVGAAWTRSVVVGGAETRVDVDLGVAIHLLGTVKDPKGRAREGIAVAVCPDRSGQLDAEDVKNPLAKWTTNDSGRYKLMLAAGKYWVFVAGDPSTAQAVEIKDKPVSLDFTWQGSLKVRFEVVGESGDPQVRCKVTWSPYGADQPGSAAGPAAERLAPSISGSAFTGEDGGCDLMLKAGIYSFHFEPLPHGNHQSKEIRQLSIGADTVRKIKLPYKPGYDEAQLTLDFSPNSD